MAIRYGKGLIGGAVVVALLALLVHWIGINTIELYRDDLLFYLQAHLILVLISMLAALIVGRSSTSATPSLPWPYWPSPSASSASAAARPSSRCSLPRSCPSYATPTKA